MSGMVHNVPDLINAKGAQAIANALGMNVVAVRLWKHRETIPRARWAELMEAFPDITLDDLRRLEAAPKSKAA